MKRGRAKMNAITEKNSIVYDDDHDVIQEAQTKWRHWVRDERPALQSN